MAREYHHERFPDHMQPGAPSSCGAALTVVVSGRTPRTQRYLCPWNDGRSDPFPEVAPSRQVVCVSSSTSFVAEAASPTANHPGPAARSEGKVGAVRTVVSWNQTASTQLRSLRPDFLTGNFQGAVRRHSCCRFNRRFHCLKPGHVAGVQFIHLGGVRENRNFPYSLEQRWSESLFGENDTSGWHCKPRQEPLTCLPAPRKLRTFMGFASSPLINQSLQYLHLTSGWCCI